MTVLSLGAVGSTLMANLWPALKAQLPMKPLLVIGAFDEHATERQEHYRMDGVLDISPAAKEIAEAQRESPDLPAFRQRLLRDMLRRVRQSVITADAMEGQVILLAGPEALDAPTCELLADLKRRRPEQEIIVVCANPWLDSEDPHVVAAFERLRRMHTAGEVAAVVLPRATQNQKEHARRVGIAVASLIGARVYDLENPSLVGVARRLTGNGPFIGLRADAIEVDATLPVDGPIFARHQPIVSLSDAVTQARHLSAPMLEPGLMGAIVYTVPLRPQDARWARFCDEMRAWLDRQRDGGGATLPIFMPSRQLEIHAAALYPLAEVRALATRRETLAELAPYLGDVDAEERPTAPRSVVAASATTHASSASASGANGRHPVSGAQPSDEPLGLN